MGLLGTLDPLNGGHGHSFLLERGQPPSARRAVLGLAPQPVFHCKTYRFFLSDALFPEHPKHYSTEHQEHCRVFLEIFKSPVASFRHSDSNLDVSASLLPGWRD